MDCHSTYDDEADDRLDDALTTQFENKLILRQRNLVVKQSIDLNLKKTFKLKATSDKDQHDLPQQYKTYTKNRSSKCSKRNLNLDLSELDLMDAEAADADADANANGQSNSDLSVCSHSSSSSTPSPSSSSSCSSSHQHHGESKKLPDHDQLSIHNSSAISASTSDVNSPTLLSAKSTSSANPATNPFFFNYNSLMNVSMLDSIQVTNNNLDLDTMSSSILMFN